jgi:hypothetical protein
LDIEQPETLAILVVLTVVPAKLDVPQGKGVAFEHKSLEGATGAGHDVQVIVVVQQLLAVPQPAFVL